MERTKEVQRVCKERKRESSMPYGGKSIAKQHIGKRSGKHSKRGGLSKGSSENFQNVKRSIVGYWY